MIWWRVLEKVVKPSQVNPSMHSTLEGSRTRAAMSALSSPNVTLKKLGMRGKFSRNRWRNIPLSTKWRCRIVIVS